MKSSKICYVCGYEERSVNSLKTHMGREHDIEAQINLYQSYLLNLTHPSQLREKYPPTSSLSPSSSHPFLPPHQQFLHPLLPRSSAPTPIVKSMLKFLQNCKIKHLWLNSWNASVDSSAKEQYFSL